MFVFYDVASDSHSKSGTLSNGLGGKEVLKETLFHFFCHTFTIVSQRDNNLIIIECHTNIDLWLIVGSLILRKYGHGYYLHLHRKDGVNE